MSDAESFKAILERYLKARIPFISLKTTEIARMIEIFKIVTRSLNIPIYIHTLSKGMKDLNTGKTVNEDRTVEGALNYISQQIGQRQNLTFVLTDVSFIEDDTPPAHQLQDVVTLAAETGGVIAVITTKPVWGQLQRKGMNITLDAPNEDEILKIIQDLLHPYKGQMPINWTIAEEKEASTILAGISQVETENIIAMLLAKGSVEKEDVNELRYAKDRIFSDISGIERVVLRKEDLNIGGLDGLKKWLAREKPLITADLRERRIRSPRGILLVGVPGCGKSLSAKAVALEWNLPLYRLDLATMYGQYLGQSEARFKDALSTADHVAPCVLWIDEIEKGLAGGESSADWSNATTSRIVGQFLFWLQESQARVFVVATANQVTRLPPELLRRGRFDELFFVDLPNPEERKDIISIYIKRGLKKDISPELMNELVKLSEGFAGCDIEYAIREVVIQAFLKGDDAINDEFFRLSFTNVVPLSKVSPEQIDAIRTWGKERAVPASEQPIGEISSHTRTVLHY